MTELPAAGVPDVYTFRTRVLFASITLFFCPWETANTPCVPTITTSRSAAIALIVFFHLSISFNHNQYIKDLFIFRSLITTIYMPVC